MHPASTGSTDDELEILKAKRGKPVGSVDGKRSDEVETLKAKVAGSAAAAAADGEATTRNALKTKLVERSPPSKTLPREAVGVGSLTAKLDVPDEAANDEATPRRDPLFDLAFVLVMGLWAIGIALALTRGAEWWFFAFCMVVTTAVALVGLFD